MQVHNNSEAIGQGPNVRHFSETVGDLKLIYQLHSSGRDWASFQDTVIATASTIHNDRPITISISGPWGQMERIRSEAVAVIEEIKTFPTKVSSFAAGLGLVEIATNDYQVALEGIQTDLSAFIAKEFASDQDGLDLDFARYLARLVADLFQSTLSGMDDCPAIKDLVVTIAQNDDIEIVSLFVPYSQIVENHHRGLQWADIVQGYWDHFLRNQTTETYNEWVLAVRTDAPENPETYWKPDGSKAPAYADHIHQVMQGLIYRGR